MRKIMLLQRKFNTSINSLIVAKQQKLLESKFLIVFKLSIKHTHVKIYQSKLNFLDECFLVEPPREILEIV